MKLSETKTCEYCKKEFTGRRVLSDPTMDWDDAPCWCSNRCFSDEERHNEWVDDIVAGCPG